MGLYSHYIFPRLMDWVMRGDEFQRWRAVALQDVRGEVLEIGLGTGLNLPHYPKTVSQLHAVDPAPLLPERMARRSKSAPFPIHITRISAETLPFDERRFDCVVSTWTLCTIADPIQAIQEVRRVLKPSGRFLFLEHGRSENEKLAAWQDRLNPIQRIVGCGCNLNRRIDQLVSQAGLRITKLDRFQMEGIPRLVGEMYGGVAIAP